jgi:UDP-N-acetylmuramate--alanine ligase
MDHIHFIGIGGTGLSAIAIVLLEEGYKVSGSDLVESPLSEAVNRAGGKVFIGHQAENISGADIVIQSSAVPADNVEVQAALAENIPVYKRSEFLGFLTEGKNTIAVAGTHGKTTTSSMITWLLTALGKDPSFIIGGIVANLGTNARAGRGDDFVIEADEYDHMFLGLNPSLAVVTNVEHDHPDLFPTEESFQEAFREFVGKLHSSGTLILCAEDPGALKLENELQSGQKRILYGFDESRCDYFARNIQPSIQGGVEFEIGFKSEMGLAPIPVSLKIPGKHNVLNAMAAFAAVNQFEMDREKIAASLGDFQGSGRRFEIRGEYQGIILVDDYAHHPTEIKATLSAARASYPERRIWAVWQPHTYSRTKTLFSDFTGAFSDADRIIVLDVYAAREKKPDDFDLKDLVKKIKKKDVEYIPSNKDAADYLSKELSPGDLLLVFTAGDAIEITDSLERVLAAEAAQ